MRRSTRLLLVCALAAAVPATALGAQRMWVGFQDDPSFRWREDRGYMLDRARDHNASIVRTTVYWSRVAPVRPANAADPFDPAYRWDDLDEFVRGAQRRGLETMLTIWGTPGWANGGKGQNRAPANLADLTAFARALATRYSGRYPGLPFARFFTVWNESNLEQFLAPTFDTRGKPVAPFVYAKLYRAAYAGIKAGSPQALVGIGETSPRGRDRLSPSPGRLQNTLSPGLFARLLSTVRPKLRFDAWSHHPYSELGRPPTQRVRFPNVNLTQLKQFERSLDTWFGRTNIPIWITEYGHETKPGEPKGVTAPQQAAYMQQALAIARDDRRVQVFVWFIFRDDETSTWQSGLLGRDGTEKPASNAFAGLAKLLDARNPIVTVSAGVNPVLRIPVLELAARSGVGAAVGCTLRVFNSGKLIGVSQPQSTIAVDGWASFPVPIRTQAGGRYSVTFEIGDANGNKVVRSASIVVP